MIHEPAKWAGWQSTTAAAQHLDRLKQMQGQIYRILAERSGKPLRQIIRDTKRNDFYLDAIRAKEYGLIDGVLGPVQIALPSDLPSVSTTDANGAATPDIAAAERQPGRSDRLIGRGMCVARLSACRLASAAELGVRFPS